MSEFSVLLVDDDERHLNRMKSMICHGLDSSRGVLGLAEHDIITIDTQTDTEEVVQCIECGTLKHNIIIADVFMPVDIRGPCVEGGARRIYQAIKDNGVEDDVLLLVVTNRNSEAGPFLREIWREQQSLERPWTINYVKPAGLPGPESIEQLFDDNAWTYAICKAISRYRDNKWRNTFIRSTLYREMVGFSSSFTEAAVLAEQYAGERLITITGATGTGKELIAEAIHKNSNRSGRFVKINCNKPANLVDTEIFGHERGAFTGASDAKPSVFEREARGGTGTVFLDEFGADAEMLRLLDVKLRRFFASWEYERVGGTRTLTFTGGVIVAGSKLADLFKASGEMSLDLKYRLGQFRINLPPLRGRTSDIRALSEFFLRRSAKGRPKTLSPSAMKVLEEHDWPGNVRELQHMMEKFAYLMSDTIEPKDIRKELAGYDDYVSPTGTDHQFTKEQLLQAAGKPEVNSMVALARVLYSQRGYSDKEIRNYPRKAVSDLVKELAKEDPTVLDKLTWYRRQGGRPKKSIRSPQV
jgi:DNA-binding NtrC family response regulator